MSNLHRNEVNSCVIDICAWQLRVIYLSFSNTNFLRVEYEGNRTRTHNSSVLSRAHHLPGLLRLRSCSSNCFYHVTHPKGYGPEVLIRCIYTRPANRTSFMRTENWSIFSKNAALSLSPHEFSSYYHRLLQDQYARATMREYTICLYMMSDILILYFFAIFIPYKKLKLFLIAWCSI